MTVTTEALEYDTNVLVVTFYLKPHVRSRQDVVLSGICDAYNSEPKVMVRLAPTRLGKSPVTTAVARTLGSSYFCNATKDLQGQYVKDFPEQ